jgi:hypothetical protein
VYRGETHGVLGGVAEIAAADHRYDRNRACASRDDRREFAVQGLVVDSSLAGDDEAFCGP